MLVHLGMTGKFFIIDNKDKKFKTNLNLIQTYKSLSIAEGMRLVPNNPVFLLKGKK